MPGSSRVTRKEQAHQTQLQLEESMNPADTGESRESGSGELPNVINLALEIRDADTIAELVQQGSSELQREYALKALRIGVLALRQARGAVDADAVRHESDRLLTSLQERLTRHSETVNEHVSSVLKDYFDPQNGRFQERLHRLLKRDGELEEVLRRQIGQDDSELRKTLSSHIGEDSTLMKMLSPDESQGVLGALRDTLSEQLKNQRELC